MKTLYFTFFICLTSLLYSQNLIVNGNFETGVVSPWQGFKNHITTDNLTNSEVGNIENGDGSLFQVFNVISGETIKLSLTTDG